MMKARYSLMAAIIALALVIPAASVGADTPPVPASGTGTATAATYQIVPLQNIYLRSTPSYSDNTIALLKTGQVGTFVGKASGTWIKVTFDGKTGYVNSISTGKVLYTGTTTVNVNLRKGAGTSYSVITVLKKDSVVHVIGGTSVWLKVAANSQIGYLYRDYVKKTIVQAYPYAGVTTVDVYFREGPDAGYAAISVLKKGTAVTVLSKTWSGWLKATVNGKTGYVYSLYVTKAPVPPAVLYKAAALVDVHFRSGPGTGYASLTVLKKGTQVSVIGRSGSWLRITYNGKAGYAYADYFLRLSN